MFKNLFQNANLFFQKTDAINSTLLILLVFIFPIFFLTIRHGVHLSLYFILFLFIYELTRYRIQLSPSQKAILIAISLSGIFIATGLQQVLTANFNPKAFDGPSRLFIAGIIFLYLRQKNLNYFSIIEIAVPIGLIFLTIYLQFNQQYFWGPRWANNFVDPNSLGSQATILSMLCIMTIDVHSKKIINFLKLIGIICGLYVSIQAESRGGWVTIPAMITSWLAIQSKEKSFFDLKKIHSNLIFLILFLLIAGVVTLVSTNNAIHNRILFTVYEITNWLRDPTIHTSTGSRLSMWVVSAQLISENWMGYGEIAIKEIAAQHPLNFSIHQNGMKDLINAGPHSDILSKGLSLGIFGILSYLAIIFLPLFIFFSKITDSNYRIRKAAKMGSIYITGVFISGLFNETLSLKYLCSFYGLMIACLAADVLRDNSHTTELNGKVV
jgi:O-antigen ligase